MSIASKSTPNLTTRRETLKHMISARLRELEILEDEARKITSELVRRKRPIQSVQSIDS